MMSLATSPEQVGAVVTRGSESFTGACASLVIGCSCVGRGGGEDERWTAMRVELGSILVANHEVTCFYDHRASPNGRRPNAVEDQTTLLALLLANFTMSVYFYLLLISTMLIHSFAQDSQSVDS
jgi:hypothetical protein